MDTNICINQHLFHQGRPVLPGKKWLSLVENSSGPERSVAEEEDTDPQIGDGEWQPLQLCALTVHRRRTQEIGQNECQDNYGRIVTTATQ